MQLGFLSNVNVTVVVIFTVGFMDRVMYRVRFKAGVRVNVRDCVRVKPIVGVIMCYIYRRLREMVPAGSLVLFRVSAGATIRVRYLFRVFVRGLELGLA